MAQTDTYLKGEDDVEGTVRHAQFIPDNQIFMSMDSSLMHHISFNEAISLVVECETQEEIDYYWGRLTEAFLKMNKFDIKN